MAQTILILISVSLQLYILYLIHRLTRGPDQNPTEPLEKKPRVYVTSAGKFAVESSKRKPTINDDETLYLRELEE